MTYGSNVGRCRWHLVPCTRPASHRGLCRHHYDQAMRLGLVPTEIRRTTRHDPSTPAGPCTCPPDVPVRRCRIVGGRVPIADAFECQRCGRYVPTAHVGTEGP